MKTKERKSVMILKVLIVLLVAVMTISLASVVGCRPAVPSYEETTETAAAETTETAVAVTPKKVTIGMIVPTLANEFWVRISKFSQVAAEQLGFELIVLESRDSGEVQIKNAEDLIARQVDGLIFVAYWATGPQILGMTEKAGIPTIVMDTYVVGVRPNDTYKQFVAYMGPSNIISGYNIATYLIDNMRVSEDGKKNMVALLGTLGTSVAEERAVGLEKALGEYPDVQLLSKQTGEFRRDLGMKVMEDFLSANSDIGAVWNANDEMALGAIMAIKNAGRQDEIIVGGMDLNDEAVEAVIKGDYAFTLGGHWLMGGFVSTMMYDYLNGFMFTPEESWVELQLPSITNEEEAAKLKEKYLPYPSDWDFKEHSKVYNPNFESYFTELSL